MKWRWKITRDLRNDYITRQLWVQILFANFPGFKNNVLFIMTDFRHENNFRTNLSFLTDSKSFGWQRELKVKAWKSLFLSLLQRVSMSEVRFLCSHGMDTWNLKVERYNQSSEMHLRWNQTEQHRHLVTRFCGDRDISCLWMKKGKKEKSRKSFCGYFTSSWSGRGSFCNHRNLVWNKKKNFTRGRFWDLLVWIESIKKSVNISLHSVLVQFLQQMTFFVSSFWPIALLFKKNS
jgi:hypothetical protein